MESRTLILSFLGLFLPLLPGQAQSLNELGLEVQGYPAGVIFGVRYDFTLATHLSANVRAGYNLARRRDLGEHDDERGGGPGASLGARYYFKEQYQGFFVGIRGDFWFMEIDWVTERPGDDDLRGSTDITVIQPLAEVGYTFLLGDDQWSLTPKISLGYEINVKTRGEEVGEGAISLFGLQVGRRF